jgi:hypothetical protein
MRAPQVKRAGLAALILACAAAGSFPGLDGSARADNGLPGSLGIMLPMDRPQEIVLATNFGLILSEDGGATWLWTCEQLATSMATFYAVGAPPATGAGSGALGDRYYALSPITGIGLAFSDDGSCSWKAAGGVLAGANVVIDFFADPSNPSRVLAAASFADDAGNEGAPAIYASSDGGATFGATPLFTAPAGAAIAGVEIARSAPDVIYLTDYLTLADGRDPALIRSSDGGNTWTTIDVQAALGPNQVRILAVDPVDSNLVYLRVIASTGDSVAVTRDGGMTFARPLTVANGSLTAFARLASGTVLVGARVNFDGGGGSGVGYRSTDAAMTFVPWTLSPPPHLVGLAERVVPGGPSVLYLSGENYVDNWALASSTDEGITVTPLMSYDQVRGIEACAQQTCANACNYEEMQAVWEPDVCTGALLDGGTDAPLSVPPPAKSSGCHCGMVGDRRPGDSALAFALALAVGLTRRRRARGVR